MGTTVWHHSNYGKIVKTIIKKLEKMRGELTQVAFAKKLGISKPSLNRLEIGEQNISLETIEELCNRLKCSVIDLFE